MGPLQATQKLCAIGYMLPLLIVLLSLFPRFEPAKEAGKTHIMSALTQISPKIIALAGPQEEPHVAPGSWCGARARSARPPATRLFLALMHTYTTTAGKRKRASKS